MENPRDSNSGGDAAAAAAASGDGADSSPKSGEAGATPGTSSPQQQQQLQLTLDGLPATTPEELSQLARAAITPQQQQQGPALFAAGGDDGLAGTAAAGSAEQQQALALQDPASQAALAAAANGGTINALLLNSGINLAGLGFANMTNLSQATLDGLLSGAAAGQPAAGAASGAGDGGDDDGKGGQPNNKQLSSRFRGVCWNKKNKRWQAAINSGGKYIYLGSFTSEGDAARQFDRAAIKIRGKKAKLNFLYADYVDADGNLLEDVILPTAKEDTKQSGSGKGSGRGSRNGGNAAADAAYLTAGGEYCAAGGYGDGSALGADMLNQAALALVGQGGWGAAAGRAAAAAAAGAGGYGLSAMQDGSAAAAAFGGKSRNIALLNMSDLKAILPKGCSMDYMLPGLDADMFGLVYKSDTTDQRGSGLWTGHKFHAFGLYVDEADAKNTVLRAMELLHEDRLARGAAVPAQPGARGAAADADPLLSALGLGGLRSSAAAAAGGDGGAAGVMFGAAGGGGGLANYDIARAAQLAQQAAAEQGVSISSYPALSVGLPVMAVQPVDAGQVGAGDSDLQQRLQQIMAGQQRLEAAAATADGANKSAGDVLSRLGNLDVSQLRHLLPAGQLAVQQQQQQQQQQMDQLQQQLDQQQQQQQRGLSAGAAATPVGGALGSTSIEELLSAIQSQTPNIKAPEKTGLGRSEDFEDQTAYYIFIRRGRSRALSSTGQLAVQLRDVTGSCSARRRSVER
ncbi:hypothetical protein OEZ86_003257 [Tetradesmus obliquus]|nr:hypothetical protein OEZ86_003257 [Tetradesmus obliquus]